MSQAALLLRVFLKISTKSGYCHPSFRLRKNFLGNSRINIRMKELFMFHSIKPHHIHLAILVFNFVVFGFFPFVGKGG
jgi:hypothetical protein